MAISGKFPSVVASVFLIACGGTGAGSGGRSGGAGGTLAQGGAGGTLAPGAGGSGGAGGTLGQDDAAIGGTGVVPGLDSGGKAETAIGGLLTDNPGGTWVVTPPDSTPVKPPPKGAGGTSGTGGSTAVSCTPGVVGAIVTGCGYPYASSNALTNVDFNESEVLRAIRPSIDAAGGIVSLLYADEHAMTLGVRRTVVTSASGSITSDYPVSPLTASPSSIVNPQTGTNALAGDESGLDPSLRPLWPVLYITDVTKDPQSRAGDWQMGGRPISPNAVWGTWKSAVRTIDNSTSPPTVSVTPDTDPAKNDWNFILNDPVPTGVKNEGWSAEVRWGVSFQPGHSYRLQVIVHDGDQNKVGGDCGEACIVFCAGGNTTPPPGCPNQSLVCGEGMAEAGGYASCREGESCLNGCCTTLTCPTGVQPCGQLGAEGEIIGCQSGET